LLISYDEDLLKLSFTFINLQHTFIEMKFSELKIKQIGQIDINRYRNKFYIASALFILWVSFFDDDNLVERFQNLREISQLKKDKEYYIQKISEDSERLKELKTNNENLEKYAREQFLMKKDNEDIFVIVEE
jgi:cell division protein DivIC